MKVYCEYSDKLDSFLRKVVAYTIEKYGDSLDLSNLQTIELKNIKEFGYETDGKTLDCGKTIWVTSRLYDMLPVYDIQKLGDDKNFKLIVNSLYHEMGHVSDWKKFPQIYKAGSDTERDEAELLPAIFWLEYLAEKRSSQELEMENKNFCEDFSHRRWNAYKFDYELCSELNFVYLNKCIPYFLGKTTNHIIRQKYIDKMPNRLLAEYIVALEKEIFRLEECAPFDDVGQLHNLYDIMMTFREKFKIEFSQNK